MTEHEMVHMPKYAQLMKIIKDQIINRELKPGEVIPTRGQMMQKYNYSLSTVTRAVAELERQGWLISRQGSGTTVSNRLPVLNQPGRQKTVGFLFSVSNPDGLELSCEISLEAHEHNIKLISVITPDDIDTEMDYARFLLEQSLDALIWAPVQSKTHIGVASLFNRNGIPVIVCEKTAEPPGPLSVCVRSDHYGGMQKVLSHFRELGHERIAYVGPSATHSTIGPRSERWNSYRDFMREHNLWEPDALVIKPAVLQEWHVHSRQIENRFLRADAPTAVVGYDDHTALNLAGCLQHLGFHIPDEISIAGNGDQTSSQFFNPRLTTVSICHAEYVDILFRTLRKMLHRERPFDTGEIVVPQRLINRDSAKAVSNLQLNKAVSNLQLN